MQRQLCVLLVLAGVLLPVFATEELLDDDLERDRRILGSLLGGGQSSPGLLGGLLGSDGLLGGVLGGVLGGGGGGGGGGRGSSGAAMGGADMGNTAGSAGGSGGLLGGLLGGGGGGGGLLGGLLGGGGGSGGGAGGLLGGLLGGGGGSGGGGGLLGGLLGGGGQGGLLGSLLGGGGGGGLLGGLVGGNNSLVGNLLGGGGLLGGVLGDKGLLGGLLGAGTLTKLLNTLFCLIEQLGLGLVLELLRGLGAETLLGLNEIACQENGDGILSFLITKNGILPATVIQEVLCLVKTLGANTVLRLLQTVGLERVLALNNITCPDGDPLLAAGSTAAALFKLLIDAVGIESVNAAGVEGIIKLDKLLTQEGVQDLTGFVRQVTCLINNLGLGAVIDTLEVSKINGVLRLNEAICRNQTALVDLQSAVRAGLNVQQVLPPMLKAFGLDTVLQLINYIGLSDLLQLGSFFVVNGTVQPNFVNPVFCVSNSLGVKLVIRLLQTQGLPEVLALNGIVCPNGVAATLPPNANAAFLVVLLNTCKPGNQITQCLQTLAVSLNENGLLVCPFCSRIGIKAIADECTRVCTDNSGR